MTHLKKVSAQKLLLLVLAPILLLLNACMPIHPGSGLEPVQPPKPTISCSAFLDNMLQRERSGDIYGSFNEDIEIFQDYCRPEFEIYSDYVSIATFPESFEPYSCEQLSNHRFSPSAIELARQDGLCVDDVTDKQPGSSTTSPTTMQWPEGGLGWNEASAYMGTYQRVCGPLASARDTDYGTFVNVGRDYPSLDRFTFVLWDIWLEPIPSDSVICAAGEITFYEGISQMEVYYVGDLELWR